MNQNDAITVSATSVSTPSSQQNSGNQAQDQKLRDMDRIPYLGALPFEKRNEALKALANLAGMRLPNTIVREGESLLPIGQENLKRMQAEIRALPDLEDGLNALRYRIWQESPKDATVPIQQVRMTSANGGLYGLGQDPAKALAYTDSGFSQVCSFLKPPSVRYGFQETLLALPPHLRAEAFNHFATTSIRDTEKEQVVFRTLVNVESKRRAIRAVTSTRHSLESGDDLALSHVIQHALPLGGKLRITRTFDRTDFEVIWPAMERQIRVGDIVQIAIVITNSETKGYSIRIEPKVLRVRCWNLTVAWSDGLEEELVIRHLGDLRTKLPAMFRRAVQVVDPFVQAFGDAYAKPFPMNLKTRGEVMERLCKKLDVPKGVAQTAIAAWDADGLESAGDTLGGLVNALTRASQELTMEKGALIERTAGRLIMTGWDALN